MKLLCVGYQIDGEAGALLHSQWAAWLGRIMNFTDRTYDPETITILRAALDDAWASMSASQQALTTRSALAVRLLSLAARGERDPVRLRAHALSVVETKDLQPSCDQQVQQTG